MNEIEEFVEKLTVERLDSILDDIAVKIDALQIDCPICGHDHCVSSNMKDVAILFDSLKDYMK